MINNMSLRPRANKRCTVKLLNFTRY